MNTDTFFLLLRWYYSPMRTFAYLMDFSQSHLFYYLSINFVIMHLLVYVCTQFHHLFFVCPISRLSWGIIFKHLNSSSFTIHSVNMTDPSP
jgi:hypothetical protein